MFYYLKLSINRRGGGSLAHGVFVPHIQTKFAQIICTNYLHKLFASESMSSLQCQALVLHWI